MPARTLQPLKSFSCFVKSAARFLASEREEIVLKSHRCQCHSTGSSPEVKRKGFFLLDGRVGRHFFFCLYVAGQSDKRQEGFREDMRPRF